MDNFKSFITEQKEEPYKLVVFNNSNVDVRDVAKAHIFSMLNSSTNNKRIIVSESEMFFVDVGRILNDAGFKKSHTKQMPNWLVKFLALFI